MPVAERILHVETDHGRQPVAIRVFQPLDTGFDWVCRYEIDWPEGTRQSSAHGVDGIQALHLALQKIGIDLYVSEAHKAGRLVWERWKGGYGFPVPKSARDMLVGDDRIFEG